MPKLPLTGIKTIDNNADEGMGAREDAGVGNTVERSVLQNSCQLIDCKTDMKVTLLTASPRESALMLAMSASGTAFSTAVNLREAGEETTVQDDDCTDMLAVTEVHLCNLQPRREQQPRRGGGRA